MLQPDGSDTPATEPAPPAPLRMIAREGRTVTLEPDWRAGRKLESAREQLGLTMEQVAALTRVRREYLEALEDMDAKRLPGRAYALAYLRSYVQVLGLEKSGLVDQFLSEVALTREDARPQVRDPVSRPRAVRPWMPVLALSLAVGGFVGWQLLKDRFIGPDPVVSAAEAAQAPAPVRETSELTSAPGYAPSVEIRALADAHLEVRGPDGTIYMYRTLQAGDVYSPDPGPGWTLHARDGGAFEVRVDGAPAGLLGEPGKPVLGRRFDEIQSLELAAGPAQMR